MPPWYYFPILSKTQSDLVLCCHGVSSPSISESLIEPIQLLAQAVDTWSRQNQKTRELIRLNQILNVAADWHSHQDLDRLLQDIAQAATRLLKCDRASIFLWDKQARELVGHPALGIEGKPLRIADDKGVAGAVLKSLQPRRWDRSDPHDEVDRRVDTSSGYRTDSLLAVPLIDQKGKSMGVFEVINHADGRFETQDEADLIELARHASAALSNTQQMQRLIQTRDRLTRDALQQVQLIGNSPEMLQLKSTIARVGDTDLAVLLLGMVQEKRSFPGRFTTKADVALNRLSPSTARRSPKPCSRANCSAMKRERSQTPTKRGPASLNWHRVAPCFWMRLET
jgi:Nif-specific regulatory protein